MWYQDILKKQSNRANSGFDASIIVEVAERETRRLLFMNGEHYPNDGRIATYVNKIVNQLIETHGNLENVRRDVQGQNVSPIVKEVAAKIVR